MEGGMIMTMMRAPEVAPRAEHQGHSKHLQRAQLLLLRRLRAMQLPWGISVRTAPTRPRWSPAASAVHAPPPAGQG